MANMSHCRFENTARDLSDCLEALDDGAGDNLGEDEARARRVLIRLCREITEAHGESVK